MWKVVLAVWLSTALAIAVAIYFTHDIDGRIFSRDGGKTWFAGSDSHVDITFPYTPPVHPEEIILDEDKK